MASNEWLVRKLHEQDKKIEALSRGGTGVGHSSIAPGENLTVISDNGEVVLGAGGVDHVDGPTPATPSAPTLKLGFGTIETTWDGTFAEGEDEDGVPLVAPVDFDVVEVHCSTDPEEEEWGEDTMRGQIKTREGGTVTVGGFDVDDEVFVCLIALAKTGKRSGPSATASLVIEGLDFAQLTNELDAATVTIGNAREVLLDGQNTLGEKLDAADTALSDLETTMGELDSTTLPALRTDLDAAEGRLDAAEGQITDAFGQLDAVPGQISDARQAAIDAARAELDQVEGTLTSMIGGKSTTKWSTSNPPAQYSGAVGDTWVKLTSLGSGGREIKRSRWQGDVWVDHPVDGAVLSNVDASTITTGFLDVANRVRAGSISTNLLAVGLAGNLLPDPLFTDPAVSALRESGRWEWTTHGGETCFESVMPPSLAQGDFQLLDPQGNRGYIPVSPNISQVMELDVEGPVTTFMYFVYEDGSNNTPGESIKDDLGSERRIARFVIDPMQYLAGDGSVPVRMSAYVRQRNRYGTAPAGTVTRVYSARFSPMVGGTLIEPGGIQTPHLAADVLEVGNLKAGAGEIAEVVSQKIAAAVGQFLELDVGQLTVTGTSSLSDVVAERIAAETAEFIQLEVGNLVAGTGTMDTATINKLFSDVVVASMAQAEQFIGENAILTGAVTAPKITASEELWAKIAQFVKIRAEHIEADAIDGMVVTGATIRTSGGSGEWSDAGLRINAPSGESLVNFPTNGEPLSLNADSTTIRSASISELEAGDTSLTTGSTLTLEAGQLAYPRAPEVRADWYPSATFTRPNVEYSHDWLGLAAWGDKWVRTVNVLGSAGESLDSIEVYDSDGIHAKTIYLDINPRHGVAVVGDVAYVMGPDKIARPGPEKNWVHGFNLNTGNRVTRWEFTRNVTNRFGMGTDGTNLVFAAVGASGPLYVTRFDPTSGASAGPDLITTDWVKYTNDVEGVAISGNILWVSHREAVRKFTISGSAITYTGTGWVNPNKNGNGIDMSKGWPFVVTSSGNLFEGSVFTSDPTIIEAGVTFRDNAGHETDMSQTSTVSLSPRECAAISIPSRPNLTTRVYYRQGVGQWQWWDATEGAKRFWVDFIPGTSVADPPASNTFPNSDPSIVQAAAGPFVVRGDGSGRWGPLTFNADGTMTSTAIPSWIPVTTFQTGYGAQTWGFAPAYRIWPDGKVEWRGVVAMNGTPATGNNMTTGTSDVLTVPVAARPTLAVNLAAASTAGGSNLRRVEFSSSAAPTMLRVYVGDSPGTWVSLDGLSYYKS